MIFPLCHPTLMQTGVGILEGTLFRWALPLVLAGSFVVELLPPTVGLSQEHRTNRGVAKWRRLYHVFSGLRGFESNTLSDSLEQRLNIAGNNAATAFGSSSTYGGALGKPLAPGAPTRPRVVQTEGTRSGTIGEPKSEDLDAYGMKGFLKVMAPSNPDVALLSLGIDLRTLGLNLNSPEPHLHESFKSPFGDRSASQKGDPEYQIPSCYFTQPNQMQASHFSKLQLETLFYIFYSMPQDVLQTYASLELYEREWR
mmetsp:Transcript_40438/g.160535  ORF Transcript_40438/g.160535 Transcript_40438/m.160535 type:complete len:255 (+) Transcript_40438:424-1188(+)